MKFKISKGKKKKTAIRLVCYGPEGIGKSTFASHFPDPLFIDTEGGTNQLDINRFDDVPETWAELLEMVDAVIAEPDACRTLVIDTADRAETLLANALMEEGKVDSIEKYGGGYGKGYTALAERWQKDLLLRLDRLIAKGVNVTMLAHAAMRKFESPEDPPYDRWELKVSKKNAPIIKEWSDILLFANYDVMIVAEGKKNKAKGKAKRVMYATHSPTYDAKNRFGLPDKLDFSFEPLREIYEGQVPAKPDPTVLDLNNPTDGIAEGDMSEDVRDVLIRRLEEAEISQEALTAWLRQTGRIAEDGSVADLSGTMAKSMLDNIEILKKQLMKEEK